MRPPEVLETPRLRIRKLVEEDAQVLFDRWAQDPEVTRFLPWSPDLSPEDALAYVRRCVASWEDGTRFAWILEDRETGAVVGHIAAYLSEYAAELTYLMARDSWGKGLMVEAVDAVSGWFLSLPAIYRIWAVVDTENLASARVLEKASFAREGTLRRSITCPNVSATPRDAFMYARVD